MKKTSIYLVLAMIINLFGCIGAVGAAEFVPDMAAIQKEAYLMLEDNENQDPKAAYTSWRVSADGSASDTALERTDDTGNGIMGQCVRRLSFKTAMSITTYFQKTGVGTSNNLLDLSPYNYFSFWYKGDGKAETFTLTFKMSAKSRNVLIFPIELVEGDTDWHFYSMDMASVRTEATQNIEDALTTINQLAAGVKEPGIDIYLDNMMFSKLNPMDPGEAPIDPTQEPTEEPTEKPTEPTATPEPGHTAEGPSLDDVRNGDYGDHIILLDAEEGSANYIRTWTNIAAAPAGSPGKLGGRVLQMEMNSETGKPTNSSWFTSGYFPSNNMDISPYGYFSFWYKSDGTPTAINIEFQNQSNKKFVRFLTPATEQGDTSWHFFSLDIDSARLPGWETGTLPKSNKIFLTVDAPCTVQLDNLVMTAKDPATEPLPEPEPDYEITELSFGEGNVNGALQAGVYTAVGNIVNRTENPLSGKLIFAVYDAAGTMQGVTITDQAAEASSSAAFSQTISLTGEGNHAVRAMLWDGLGTMLPLALPAQ